jgi:superfamily I DNA/RNA helicase
MTTASAVSKWSEKQDNVFVHFVTQFFRNLVVRARAGTGKTTTICEAVKRLLTVDPTRIIIVAAFGKAIAEELQTRFVGYSVTVKTLHSLGLQVVKKYWPDVKVDFSSARADDLANRVCIDVKIDEITNQPMKRHAPDAVKKLVAKLHTKGREINAHASKLGDLTEIALRFECDPSAEWVAEGFDLVYVETKALEAMRLAATEKPIVTGIDGSDMLFLPVVNGWLRTMCDDIVVDEAQDMNPTQLEIAVKVAKRVIVVGDDKQAIYAFRGADVEALDRLKTELNADELPLNVTYRCAKAIVREAQRFVPDFEAGPDNPEGSVTHLGIESLTKTAAAGDFILSRVNAPLVSIAMSLLRSGKRTRIAGRDIGKGLRSLIRQMKARTVPELLTKITNWKNRELKRVDAKFAGKTDSPTYTQLRDGIIDQAEMLQSLTDGAPSVAEVETRIESLFTDDGLGQAGMITCSSVHRAKGLESNRVFVLVDTLREDNQEERNISYVAITRAKTSLVYVHTRQEQR